MKQSRCGFLAIGVIAAAISVFASAEDAKDEAIKKDRKQIEGTWKIVTLELDGNKSTGDDINKLTVVNGADGSWILNNDGAESSQGTSTIDPTKKPKTIDLTPTVGDDKGQQYLGIYELGENTRKLCFALAGKPRPTEFSSPPGSDRFLVTFERVKAK